MIPGLGGGLSAAGLRQASVSLVSTELRYCKLYVYAKIAILSAYIALIAGRVLCEDHVACYPGLNAALL